jgi:uncharacterized membrane protein
MTNHELLCTRLPGGRRTLVRVALSALLLLGSATPQAGTFLPLPYLHPELRSNASSAISNDGTAVVGTCEGELPDGTRATHGCIWKESNGWIAESIGVTNASESLRDVSNCLHDQGDPCEGDYVVVGYYYHPISGRQTPFVWERDLGMQDLVLPGLDLYDATGVNEDGTVIVGGGDSGVTVGNTEVFRYDRISEEVDSGHRYTVLPADPFFCQVFGTRCDDEYVPVRASEPRFGVSRDGNVIPAAVYDGCCEHPAWVDFDDQNDLIEQLHPTNGGGTNVNAAGTVIIGNLGFGGRADKGFVWSADEGLRVLNDEGGGGSAHTRALNGDGSLIGGFANVSGNTRAVLWNIEPETPASVSALSVAAVFTNGENDGGYGVDPGELAGWDLRIVTGISEDGNRVTGYGKNPQNDWQAWLVVRTACQVDAGPDQDGIPEGVRVTLSGSASTSPPTPIDYEWQQVAGPPVPLNDPYAASTTFDAPYVPDNTTLTFELTARSGNDEIKCPTDTVDVKVKNSNTPPVADAGDDFAVGEGAMAQLDGTNSYDPDGDPIEYAWEQVDTGAPAVMLSDATAATPTFDAPIGAGEALLFRLRVSDAEGPSEPDDVLVTVVENAAPIADAGADQTVEEGRMVMLDGSGSADPDGGTLTYEWSGPVELSDPNVMAPTFDAPVVAAGGTTLTFVLTVTDDHPYNPKSDSDSVAIHVQNVNDPPDCTLARCDDSHIQADDTCLLWPPNHRMVSMTIAGIADPDDDEVVVEITGITQDEPVNGLGDGDTAPDGVIQSNGTALLRAERAGPANGRVYAVAFTASDDQGGMCTGTVTVGVPHSRKSVPVDDGQAFDSTLP